MKITVIADSQKFLAAQERKIKEEYPEVEIVLSHVYSLQTPLLKNVERGSILALSGIGVRYDDVKQYIHDFEISVYRADKPWELTDLLDYLKTSKDVTKFLADLDEH